MPALRGMEPDRRIKDAASRSRGEARNPPGVTSMGADFGELLLLRLFERDLGGGNLAKCRHDFLIITFH